VFVHCLSCLCNVINSTFLSLSVVHYLLFGVVCCLTANVRVLGAVGTETRSVGVTIAPSTCWMNVRSANGNPTRA
jgi:hypothetical protein